MNIMTPEEKIKSEESSGCLPPTRDDLLLTKENFMYLHNWVKKLIETVKQNSRIIFNYYKN